MVLFNYSDQKVRRKNYPKLNNLAFYNSWEEKNDLEGTVKWYVSTCVLVADICKEICHQNGLL